MEWRKKKPVYEFNDVKEDITTILSKIHGIDDVDRFLNPTGKELHNPNLLKNMELVIQRIDRAINEDETITLHIDPDNDGVTSFSLFYKFLNNFTENTKYIHSQRSHGHGIEYSEHLIPEETKLLIIIDSSSNSVESCKRISEKGIDIIIIDHHKIEQQNPYCLLINPQQPDCQYPNKNSSASVVAWKVAQALDEYYATDYSKDLIDLSAVGLIGDVMSLREMENRYIVREGLSNINNFGLKFLLQNLSKDISNLSAQDIAYSISPCLNACARLDKLEIAIDLLTNNNAFATMGIASKVIKLNEERKRQQSKFLDGLLPLSEDILDKNNKCVILIDNEIGAGYRGLVANDLANIHNVPVMILSSDEDGTCKGSFRAGSDFNLREFLLECPRINYAAGHGSVGGLSFHIEDLDIVYTYFNYYYHERQEPVLEYVYELDVTDLNEAFVSDVESFYKVSGKGFETGLFKVTGINILKRNILGDLRNTIKLTDKNTGIAIMKFRTNEDFITEDIEGKNIEVIGQLNLNKYNGKTSMQVFLNDYRIVD